MAESIKGLVGRKMSKTMKFLGADVTINKLSVEQVLEVQEHAKTIQNSDEAGLALVKKVVALGVDGGSDLTDEDFQSFPLDELSKLSTEIMKFSGVITEESKGK